MVAHLELGPSSLSPLPISPPLPHPLRLEKLHLMYFSSQCSFISPDSFPISSLSAQGNIIKRVLVIWGKGINKLRKCSNNEQGLQDR